MSTGVVKPMSAVQKLIMRTRKPRKVPVLFKVPGVETPDLFKFVSKASFKFDPFNEKARSVREVWRDLSSSRYAKSNPKAKLTFELVKDEPSALTVSYIDGRVEEFEPDGITAREIFSEIWYNAFDVEWNYRAEQKPLPT